MRRILLAGAAFALFSGPISMSALAADPGSTASGKCDPTGTKYVVSDENVRAASESFANMPNSKVRFASGGNRNDCVIVRITGEIVLEDNLKGTTLNREADAPLLRLRVRLDGGAAIPAEIVLPVFQYGAYPYAREFVFKGVAPGDHKVQVQWSNSDPRLFIMDSVSRSLVVEYRK